MAATKTINGGLHQGAQKAIIIGAETNQLVSAETVLRKIIVFDVGSTATLDIYDATSGTSNRVFKWVSADGKIQADVNIPMKNGLRVITGGTPGDFTLVYD